MFRTQLKEIAGTLFRGMLDHKPDPSNMGETFIVWKTLDHIEKVSKAKKTKLHAVLMEWTERLGEPTEKGGKRLVLDGNVVERQRRVDKEPDGPSLKMFLQGKSIPVTDVYDEVKALVFNPSKLRYLADRGVLSSEDMAAIESMHGVSWAMQTKAGNELEELLKESIK